MTANPEAAEDVYFTTSINILNQRQAQIENLWKNWSLSKA